MRYLGLDLGSRTLGIAISDALGMIARNLETFRFTDDDYETAADYLIQLANKEKITEVVLGLPKHANGDCGIRAQISYDFKDLIEKKSNIKVHLIDERLTTRIANSVMLSANMSREKRKAKKDELAAVIILQNFLDRRR